MNRLRSPVVWSLILVSSLGIGLVIVIAVYRGAEEVPSHRKHSTRASLKELHSAVNHFYMDNGRWPTQAEGLSVLIEQPADAKNWPVGGYLETVKIPKDEWGRDFIYQLNPGDGRPFLIKSLGADGAKGGEEYDRDMLSTERR